MKNKVLLLDIDYTIHDNSLFKNLLGKDFQSKFSISKNKIINIYKLLLNETGFFKPDLFVERLSKEIGYDHKIEINNNSQVLGMSVNINLDVLPNTGLSSDVVLTIIGFGFIFCGFVIVYYARKKRITSPSQSML